MAEAEFGLTETDRQDLRTLLYSKPRMPVRMDRQLTPRDGFPEDIFHNDSGEAIPPFAVMEIDGVSLTDGRIILEVIKPTSSGVLFLFNGPREIPTDKYGIGFREGRAKISSSSDPSLGFGPDAGEWHLAPGVAVFTKVGALDSDTAYFFANHSAVIIGKTNSTHNKGENGTINIWSDVSTDTEQTIEAMNLFGPLGADKWVAAVLINGIWYLIAGEC